MAAADYNNVVQQLYVAYFGRPADPVGLMNFTNALNNAGAPTTIAGLTAAYDTNATIKSLVDAFGTSTESANLYTGSTAAFVNAIFTNVLGRSPALEGLLFWSNAIDSGALTRGNAAAAIMAGAQANTTAQGVIDAQVVANKVTVAANFTAALDTTAEVVAYSGSTAAASARSMLATVTNTTDTTAFQTTVTSTVSSIVNAPVVGTSYTLTTGVDNVAGGSGNDTITAADIAGVAAWTTGDAVDGGNGTDVFNIVSNGAIAVPTAATVANIETANMTSGSTITANTSSWTGLTALNTSTSGAAQTLTAGASTNVTATAAAQAATGVSVNGGNAVTVNATGVTTGTTTVGATTAAAGAVSVTAAGASAGNTTMGNIGVTGGTTVSVTTSETASSTNTDTDTQSNINVTGNASTTSVTVTQTAAAAATATKGAIANGTVDVLDANRASATAAGTIQTVTITNAGAATVNSGALTTLNLGGTLTTVDASTLGALTTAANTTLAVNFNGATSTGAVTIDTDITTLNIGSSTKASTINSLVANGATTVNVSGDAALTLTGNTLGAVTAITVTNTAGASFGSAIGAGVLFTGGAGADAVTLTNSFTKAITMGDGDDTVTVGGTTIGTGGSVAAGNGTDTIVMTSAQAATFDDNATFNTKFTGFEVLKLSDALGAGTTLNLAGLNNVSKVVLAAGGANTTTSILDNLANNGTVQFDANSTGVVIQETNALFNAADTLNLVFNKSGGVLAAGSITAAGVETINITANDASTASGGSAANVNTATLVATGATTVTVSGNNGLNLTNTGNTAITKFDASGVVANGTAGLDTAANLAVTFASANTTATATVTITGGAGNDVLTGNAAKDVINGGAGNDLINGGTNADTITVGSGRDIVQIVNNDDDTAGDIVGSGTGTMDAITGFSLVSSAISGVDFSSDANFQGSTAGGANLNLLNIDLTADDAGAGAGANQAIAVEANGTGSGQAAGVTYTVTNGILTLSGVGATNVDTLGEWLVEAAAVAATNGDILAFQFGSDTYVFAQNGTADMLVQLVGVTGATSLVEVSAGTTAAAGSILYADLT